MVLKKKRGLSKLEFYHNARKMRKELTMLVLRDFGIHSRGAKFKADTGSQQPEGFYDELLEDFSRNIRHLLRNLMMNITAANTIYPINEAEMDERRLYQDRAIIACEQRIERDGDHGARARRSRRRIERVSAAERRIKRSCQEHEVKKEIRR